MNPARLTIVPDERWEGLSVALRAQLAGLADSMVAANIGDTMSGLVRSLLSRLQHGLADVEVIVWARAKRGYLAGWTSLEPEEEVTLVASADAEAGLVAQVFGTQRTAVQRGAEMRAGDWTNLEARRGRSLGWMAASPVLVFDRCAAVVSMHQFHPAETPADTGEQERTALAETAALAGRLIEDHLIRAALGLETR